MGKAFRHYVGLPPDVPTAQPNYDDYAPYVSQVELEEDLSRAMGLSDPRSYGSGNPGATNVLRSGNKAAAGLTLAFDVLKGYVPVLLVVLYGARFGLGEGTLGLVGLAAFLGHLWPVFCRFVGGKGVATALGVLLGLNPWLGLGTLATWLIIASSSVRSVMVASVYFLSRPASSCSRRSGGNKASSALPFAVQCSGKALPIAETATRRCIP